MIERKLSAAFILALFIQMGGAMLWAGATTERIAQLEEMNANNRPKLDHLIRLEAELEAIRAQLDRIETKLDRQE